MKPIPCMKGTSYPEIPPSYEYGLYAEPKFDGHRHIVRVYPDGTVEAWSSLAKDANRKMDPGLIEQLKRWIPGVYDGELHLGPKGTSSEVAKIVNRPHLIFEAFDILAINESTLIQRELYKHRRRELLLRATTSERTRVVQSELIYDHEAMKALRDREWGRGGEGLMLKNPNSIYKPGGRSKDWYKVKACQTAATTVIDYVPPKIDKPFEHGAVHLRDDEGRTTSVKVLNLVEKARCLKLHEEGKLIGRRLQIEYQQIIKGSYRHPRWDHWLES